MSLHYVIGCAVDQNARCILLSFSQQNRRLPYKVESASYSPKRLILFGYLATNFFFRV